MFYDEGNLDVCLASRIHNMSLGRKRCVNNFYFILYKKTLQGVFNPYLLHRASC